MTNQFEAVVASISATVTVIFGGVLAQSGSPTDPLSGWVGTVTLMGIGGGIVTWLVARLNKSDEREEKRMERHEETIATLVALATSSKAVIEQNSKLLERVEVSIVRCQGQKQPPNPSS